MSETTRTIPELVGYGIGAIVVVLGGSLTLGLAIRVFRWAAGV